MSTAVEISVNIDVPDLEAAIEFYRLALGLHLGRRLFEGSIAEMLGASSKIYLLMKPAGDSVSSVARLPRDYDRHWTPVHLDFKIVSLRKVGTNEIRANVGCKVVTEHDPGGIKSESQREFVLIKESRLWRLDNMIVDGGHYLP